MSPMSCVGGEDVALVPNYQVPSKFSEILLLLAYSRRLDSTTVIGNVQSRFCTVIYIASAMYSFSPLPALATAITLFSLFRIVSFRQIFRFLHSSLMYKKVHKRHHEWTAPISLVSVYCHPFEHFLSNNLPVLLGPLICGAHTVTTLIWYVPHAFIHLLRSVFHVILTIIGFQWHFLLQLAIILVIIFHSHRRHRFMTSITKSQFTVFQLFESLSN